MHRRRLAWFYVIAVLDIIAWAIFIAFVLAVLGMLIGGLAVAIHAGG